MKIVGDPIPWAKADNVNNKITWIEKVDWSFLFEILSIVIGWILVFIGLYGHGIESLKALLFGFFLIYLGKSKNSD